MALNKAELATALANAFAASYQATVEDPTKTREQITEALCADIADAIDIYVKEAEVSVTVTTLTEGLQTSTQVGVPTGPPLVDVELAGELS